MRFKSLVGVSLLLAFFFTACAHTSDYLPIEKIPAGNNQEIHVAKAYDFVYLAAFDAINASSHWAPDLTSKDDGLIKARNTQYSRLDDSSNRIVLVRIRRDSLTQTSLYLDPGSRNVIGADEVLDAIRKKLNSFLV